MDSGVAELVSFFQALKRGSLFAYFILMFLVLIGLALVIGAYKRIVSKRLRAASNATQANLETIAVLRKRALGVKERDNELRKRELEVEGRDELKDVFNDTNTEPRHDPERPEPQRQVLKGSRRALNESVSHITIGLKDVQNRSKQISKG